MSSRRTKVTATTSRLDELKATLEHRRAELTSDVHGRIRESRIDGSIDRNGLDEAESAEAGVQEEIGFALIQMKAETLARIDDALRRIEEGNYGNCSSCAAEISEIRLRALPFALRCKDCEEAREGAALRARAQRSAALLLERS